MIDLIIGLTGFSGAGKSTVASIFAEYGFTVLNCDKLVHEQVYRDPQVLKAVAAAFGRDCLQGNALNRAVLRARTLGNPEETARLNQTVMPYILIGAFRPPDSVGCTAFIRKRPPSSLR